MQNIIFTAQVVAPVFLIIAIGYILKKGGIVNDKFVNVTSKFVFNVSLPALIFFNLAVIDLSKTFDIAEIIFIYLFLILSFIIIWVLAKIFIRQGRDLGTFIHGSFRSNFAIVGFAVISSVFGIEALGKSSLILAFLLPINNILAVIALTVPNRKGSSINLSSIIKEILTNPLILSVIVALPFSYFHISIHPVITQTGDYLSSIALPLALVGIGANLNIKALSEASLYAFISSGIKLIVLPLIGTFLAFELGFRGQDLGILFILFACPTAIVSFIMADAMGANSKLAGNIVLITTLGSIITITIGLFLLKEFSLI